MPNGNEKKTHCKRGHEFTPENTWVFASQGKRRICRTCRMSRPVLSSTKVKQREWSLKKIGWTTERYNAALEEQKGLCAVCSCVLTFDYNDRRSRSGACADHKHIDPPTPRGVLCVQCNCGLGNFKDDPELMRKAAQYVEKF